MSEETVSLNINVGGSASQDMQRLAESLDAAAKAEQQYAQAVKQAADMKARQQKFEKDVDREIAGREPQARKKTQQEEIRDTARNRLKSQAKDAAIKKEMDRQSGAGLAKMAQGAGKGAQGLVGALGGGMGGAAGALGALGPWGIAIGAGLMALDAGMGKAADALNIMNSGVHTNAQKMHMLAEEFVPGFSNLKKLSEALDGTTEALAKHKREIQDGTRIMQAQTQARSEVRGFEFGKMTPNESLVAAGKQRLGVTETKFDRSTAVGQRRYDEFQGVQDKKDALRQAQLQATAASRTMEFQKREYRDKLEARRKAGTEYDTAYGHLNALKAAENAPGGIRNKKGVSEAAKDAELARRKLDMANTEYAAERDRYAESATKWAEAESAARKASLEVQKAELEVMKQKEQRMAQFAQKLGAMNEGDFEMAKAALDAVREGGIENLPAEMADMAAKIAPDFIAKQREQFGEQRAKDLGLEYKDLDDPTIKDFQDNSLKTIRAAVDAKQLDVRVQIDMDAEKTAAAILEKLGPILKELKNAVDIRIDRLKSMIDLERTLQHVGDG